MIFCLRLITLFCTFAAAKRIALVAKLADAPDLGSGDFGRVGSSPIRRTGKEQSRGLLFIFFQILCFVWSLPIIKFIHFDCWVPLCYVAVGKSATIPCTKQNRHQQSGGDITDTPWHVPTRDNATPSKSVGTCRGTSGTARRCNIAGNKGVIADMPRHVPTRDGRIPTAKCRDVPWG